MHMTYYLKQLIILSAPMFFDFQMGKKPQNFLINIWLTLIKLNLNIVPEEPSDEAIVFTFNSGRWKKNTTVCNKDRLNMLKSKHYFQRGTVQNKFGRVGIYINDPKEDMVSSGIYANSTWEPWCFNAIYKHIRHDPDIGLIDIGANIGVVSLQIASLGRTVLAVEATYQNTQHASLSQRTTLDTKLLLYTMP